MSVERTANVVQLIDAAKPESFIAQRDEFSKADCCPNKVLLVAREVLSALGKGSLGLGVVLNISDDCKENYSFAMKVSSICLGAFGVMCMVTSSVCGTLSHLNCKNKKK